MFKTLMGLAAIAVILSLVEQFIRAASTLDLVVIGTVASVVAYFVRERRVGREKRPRSTSSGERTPTMPRSKS